jgi:triphosphoribosyl-dephospho-CoA synthase
MVNQSQAALRQEAETHLHNFTTQDNPKLYQATLMAWDADLKKRGINPGTSADMTVATLLANDLI